ncbi:MAG: bifunctional phosphopantothenoylcysteine decarboxylase/phosphopantothenate--cysteine ligase CoaBC [Polyangiaceae bacterium]
MNPASEALARLSGRTVALCVTGSVAAYKAAVLARLLVKAGARVLPVMTTSATRFVGPVTLAGITGEAVATDMWDASVPGELHVKIAERADLVAIVPATADFLARLASGRADDLVAAIALCTRAPVLAAPAMHPRMWHHPATRRNVATLAGDRRVTLVGPVHGEVASGDQGMGRMAEPEDIAAALAALLAPAAGADDLADVRVVVTAGPTVEDIDPVRFLGNRSSGKMGFAIAARAAARGARVTLITGPVALETPAGVHRVDVRSALSMRAALADATGPDLSKADAVIMAAAVADHRPAVTSETKVKKGDAGTIELVRNPDLIAELGAARKGARPVLVAFAVETGGPDALEAYARKKLEDKKVDFVVANPASESFGRDDGRVTLVSPSGAEPLAVMAKASIADAILGRVRDLLRVEGK